MHRELYSALYIHKSNGECSNYYLKNITCIKKHTCLPSSFFTYQGLELPKRN